MIKLEIISKSFQNKLIFKNLSYTFLENSTYGISGNNGSGKSTLLKIIAGFITPNIGSVTYNFESKKIEPEEIFKQISFAAPYIDLPLELTLDDLINFHFKFKSRIHNLSNQDIYSVIDLPKNDPISTFSSGMIQRVKLALAIFTESKILLLDEPCETLDENGFDLYKQLLLNYSKDRIVIIASNKQRDFLDTKNTINILDYK